MVGSEDPDRKMFSEDATLR